MVKEFLIIILGHFLISRNSCFGVRRQLRPLWTFTTDWRHAHHTNKPGNSLWTTRPASRLLVICQTMVGYPSTPSL